jgi:PleD family two-component response regulator
LVITDWQMPVMDGVAFTEVLRNRGFLDTYVIMLTMHGANVDYERGYLAGVDDYLTKKAPDAELFARIHGAFNTLALRRSLKETQNALEESVSIDRDSGAFAPRELASKLNSEVRRAQRYGRNVSLIVLNAMHPDGGAPAAETLRGIVQVVDASMRAHVDFIGRIETPTGASFAIVLPEAGVADAPVIKERILAGLRQYTYTSGLELLFSIGVSAVDRSAPDGTQIDARELLQVAIHCLNCPGRSGQEQLRAVQSSVACHASIVCRHGYAVDDECSMKSVGPVARSGSSADA